LESAAPKRFELTDFGIFEKGFGASGFLRPFGGPLKATNDPNLSGFCYCFYASFFSEDSSPLKASSAESLFSYF
jgi:hypothetical protein